MIRTLLIANRGEIALRIIRTARRLGLRTVAVFSDADAGAPHTRAADVAVRIGPTPAAESYLSIPALLAAAKETGADAVHPGYGFLSEQADFARAVVGAGLTWVGPPPDAMDAMGRKDTARKIAEKAGVPVLKEIPLYQPTDDWLAVAGKFTYPLLVKAAAGGGGKGMRIVRSQEELGSALAAARREAAAAFGDDTVLLERYVERGRHIEVQILADEHGNVLHLHERDCSAQRRHQKVLEEAPAPDIGPVLRDWLHAWAVALAREVGYTGVGTAEFLVEDGISTGWTVEGGPTSKSGPTSSARPTNVGAWFLEMNTRLQVEHPVTEEVVRVRGDQIDLVEQQLRVAAGEELGFAQDDIAVVGHAIEARIYAEDAFGGFLPQAGTATRVRWPRGSDGAVRVEAGIEDGTVVPAAYDPMVGKVIAHGADREAARRGLVDALDATAIGGLVTNTGFVRALANSDAFRDGEVHTAWLDTHELPPPDPGPALVAAAWSIAATAAADGGDGWRLGGPPADTWVELDDTVLRVSTPQCEVRREGEPPTSCRAVGDTKGGAVGDAFGSPAASSVGNVTGNAAGDTLLALDGVTARFAIDVTPRSVEVSTRGHTFRFVRPSASSVAAAELSDGVVLAVMPGSLARVEVSDGDLVAAGQPLGVLEAMKMEVALLAPSDGVVRVRAAAGEQVVARQVLFEMEPATDEATDEQEATHG